jgi:hypothetical protein
MDNALNPEPLDYETLQDNQPFDMEKGVEVHDYIELPQWGSGDLASQVTRLYWTASVR